MTKWWRYQKDTLEMKEYTIVIEGEVADGYIKMSLGSSSRGFNFYASELPLIRKALKEVEQKLHEALPSADGQELAADTDAPQSIKGSR